MILAASCRGGVTEELDLYPDDIAVITILHDSGALDTRLLGGSGLAAIPIERGDRAHAWIYPSGSFVDLTGVLIDASFRSALAVRVAGRPRAPRNGTCERCVLPSDTAPVHVTPGDSCLLPPFARVVDLIATERRVRAVEVPIAEVEEVRKRVYLDWPGACP